MTEEREIARLREEVSGMRQGYASLRPDVDKLLRSLYGEIDGETSFYRGFFKEFGAYRQETKDEFRQVHDENRRLGLKVDAVEEMCNGLSADARAQKQRQERLSRWALPIVVTLIGTTTTSLLGLLVLILQTYAFQP